jgi:acyl-CoA thioester hydrolase
VSTQPWPPYRTEVRPEWGDYNGHLNDAFYFLIFSRAGDAVLDLVDMGDGYRRQHGVSVFTLETHVCYLREVGVGETVEVEARVLDLDAKRLHLFQTLRRAGEADPAATAETAWLNVDMTTRRGAPFRPEIHAQLEAQRALRAAEPWPERAGRAVGLGRRPPA